MAQGCHLIYSHSDREHFPLNEKIERPTVEAVADQFMAAYNLPWGYIPSQGLVVNETSSIKIDKPKVMGVYGISEGTVDTFTNRYQNFEPRDQAVLTGLLSARGDRQADIIAGLGNVFLNDDMAQKLPSALDQLMKYDRGITGLFDAARKGASPWISNLKNTGSGKADGIAYEVLASAQMIHHPPKGLFICPNDNLDFGPKMQASYGGRGDLNVSDGAVSEVFSQPYRGTVEADLLITRSPWDGGGEIAVDFKHATGTAGIDTEQLKGVAVALKTGEVTEWHFVSNTSFSNTVKEHVRKINEDLKTSNNPTIQLHENYDWK